MTEKLLSGIQVRTLLGGISKMTLWRWEQDESLGFPKAVTFIRGRKFWQEAAILAWMASLPPHEKSEARNPRARRLEQ